MGKRVRKEKDISYSTHVSTLKWYLLLFIRADAARMSDHDWFPRIGDDFFAIHPEVYFTLLSSANRLSR